jgi:hypothetical protein
LAELVQVPYIQTAGVPQGAAYSLLRGTACRTGALPDNSCNPALCIGCLGSTADIILHDPQNQQQGGVTYNLPQFAYESRACPSRRPSKCRQALTRADRTRVQAWLKPLRHHRATWPTVKLELQCPHVKKVCQARAAEATDGGERATLAPSWCQKSPACVGQTMHGVRGR